MSRTPLPWDRFSQDIGFYNEAEMIYYFFILDCQPISCIADWLGVEAATLRYRVKKMGIPLKGRGGSLCAPAIKRRWYLRAIEREFNGEREMLKHYRWSYSELAADIGIANVTVHRRLKKHGLLPATASRNSQKFRELRSAA